MRLDSSTETEVNSVGQLEREIERETERDGLMEQLLVALSSRHNLCELKINWSGQTLLRWKTLPKPTVLQVLHGNKPVALSKHPKWK